MTISTPRHKAPSVRLCHPATRLSILPGRTVVALARPQPRMGSKYRYNFHYTKPPSAPRHQQSTSQSLPYLSSLGRPGATFHYPPTITTTTKPVEKTFLDNITINLIIYRLNRRIYCDSSKCILLNTLPRTQNRAPRGFGCLCFCNDCLHENSTRAPSAEFMAIETSNFKASVAVVVRQSGLAGWQPALFIHIHNRTGQRRNHDHRPPEVRQNYS